MPTETELRLTQWRSGSTEAERLSAAILHLEGYNNIEPQAPLGGPDGRKDILCDRGGLSWVAASYFPPTQKNFTDVHEKFLHDLEGVNRHSRQGIVFLTNQRLTLGERETFVTAALTQNSECNVYDVERLRAVLDIPAGYGVRAAFLQLSMNLDEQIAFFAAQGNAVQTTLERNSFECGGLPNKSLRYRCSSATSLQPSVPLRHSAGLRARYCLQFAP